MLLAAILVKGVPTEASDAGREERLLERLVQVELHTSAQLAEICADTKALLIKAEGGNPQQAGFFAINCAAAQNIYVP